MAVKRNIRVESRKDFREIRFKMEGRLLKWMEQQDLYY